MIFITNTIIISCWIVFVLYWVVKAFDVKRDIEDHGNTMLRLIFTLLILLVIVFRPFNSSFWRQVLWQPSLILDLLAVILTVSGLAIAVAGRLALGRNWSPHATFKQSHELIQNGVYAYVRHPIYCGMLLMIIGTTINIRLTFGFIILVLACMVFWLKIKSEEKMMTDHFPKEYKAYRKRVKAIIPYVL